MDLAQVLFFLVMVIDRVLAVRLAERYPQVIKRSSMFLLILLIWGVSIVYGGTHIGLVDWVSAYRIQIACDIVLLVAFVVSYSYVCFKVNLAKEILKQGSTVTLTCVAQQRVQYGQPMGAVIIYFYFSFLTTLSVVFGIPITPIHYQLWTFTYLFEATYHLCGLARS